LKVLAFGSYDLHQNTNTEKLSGLQEVGVEVVQCRNEFWQKKRNRPEYFSGAAIAWHALRLPLHYAKLLWKYLNAGKYDAMLVLYPGHLDLLLAKPLAFLAGKKIVFSPFISAYQNIVFQRNYAGKNSLRARLFYYLDKVPCILADAIVIDTNAHADYFSKTFGIERKKFRRVFTGAGKAFSPKNTPKNSKFTVLFYGSLIKGHGIEKILEAAEILRKEDILFRIAGSGPLREKVEKLVEEKKLGNVELMLEWLPQERIAGLIAGADIGLGLMESTEKTSLVIGNKAYEILAMKKPLVNADGAGIRELVENGKEAVLCSPNPKAIAEAILLLKNNEGKRKTIAENGYRKFEQMASTKAIGREMDKVFKEALAAE